MSDESLAKNHGRIWLEPLCSTEERCWSTEPHDCEDEGCHLPAIQYIRADLVERVILGWPYELDGHPSNRDRLIEAIRAASMTQDQRDC